MSVKSFTTEDRRCIVVADEDFAALIGAVARTTGRVEFILLDRRQGCVIPRGVVGDGASAGR